MHILTACIFIDDSRIFVSVTIRHTSVTRSLSVTKAAFCYMLWPVLISDAFACPGGSCGLQVNSSFNHWRSLAFVRCPTILLQACKCPPESHRRKNLKHFAHPQSQNPLAFTCKKRGRHLSADIAQLGSNWRSARLQGEKSESLDSPKFSSLPKRTHRDVSFEDDFPLYRVSASTTNKLDH
jgi:hypothetical protein